MPSLFSFALILFYVVLFLPLLFLLTVFLYNAGIVLLKIFMLLQDYVKKIK